MKYGKEGYGIKRRKGIKPIKKRTKETATKNFHFTSALKMCFPFIFLI